MKVSAVFVMGAVSIACLSACLADASPARAQDTGPSPLAGTTWRLSELSGEPVVAAPGAKSPYLLLQAEGGRVQGFGGCNSFSGSFELEEGGRIRFFGVAATMMACPDMEIESQLFKALETADSYAITEHGFSLHRARMAPLARFDAAPAP